MQSVLSLECHVLRNIYLEISALVSPGTQNMFRSTFRSSQDILSPFLPHANHFAQTPDPATYG